jgi:HSP20 family protein
LPPLSLLFGYLPEILRKTESNRSDPFDRVRTYRNGTKIAESKTGEKTMTLVRWAPLPEIEGLHREVNRLFDSLTPAHPKGLNGLAFIPAAELQETPEFVHLKLELPGLNAKDLDIQVSAKSVSISGDRKSQTESEDKGVTRSEFRYGRFQRIVPLPARVVNDQTQAEYKDGILTLTLPKAEGDKQKTFKVELN